MNDPDAAPVPRQRILQLIPHQGAMCLWDTVLAWDADAITLQSDSHRDPQHPLRSADRLHAVHLCEYGAQAMAVHGGLLAAAAGGNAPPGLLVALRGVQLQVVRIDALPGPLIGRAQLLASSANSQQYAFSIHHRDQLLAEGRAAVMLQPDSSESA